MDILKDIRNELKSELNSMYKLQEELVVELYSMDLTDDLSRLRLRKSLKNLSRDIRIRRTSLKKVDLAPNYTEEVLIKYISKLIGYYYFYMDVVGLKLGEKLLIWQEDFLREFSKYKRWGYCNKESLVKIYILLDYSINPYKYKIEKIKKEKDKEQLNKKSHLHVIAEQSYNRYDMICNLAGLSNISDEEYSLIVDKLISIYLKETENKLKQTFLELDSLKTLDQKNRIEMKIYILRYMYYDLNLTEDSFIGEDEKITINLLMAIKKLVAIMENIEIYNDLLNILSTFMTYLYDHKAKDNMKYIGNIEIIYILEACGVLKEEDIPVYSFENLRDMTEDPSFLNKIDELENISLNFLDKRRRLLLRDIDSSNVTEKDRMNIQLEIARLKRRIRILYSEIKGYI